MTSLWQSVQLTLIAPSLQQLSVTKTRENSGFSRPVISRRTQSAADCARAALSPATLAAYRADWQHFYTWCRGQGLAPLPAAPETVATYLASLALTHSNATRRRRLAAIAQAHRL
jgi:hypothetical protein